MNRERPLIILLPPKPETGSEALAFSERAAKLISKHADVSQEWIARNLGIDRSSISPLVRVHLLPLGIKDALRRDLITIGHAKALVRLLFSEKLCVCVFSVVWDCQLTVRQTEGIVSFFRRLGKVESPSGPRWTSSTSSEEIRLARLALDAWPIFAFSESS